MLSLAVQYNESITLIHLDDGSISINGKLVFVSLKRFRDKVCEEKVCFICAEESSEPTKEHIVPDWILKRFSLYNQKIQLPNGTLLPYRQYVLPCCMSCNQLLSRELEAPISKAFKAGFEGVEDFLMKGNRSTLFVWLALIFVKMHCKDNSLPLNRDHRENTESIAKELEYDWGLMHHIYCLARASFSEAIIQPEALGSLCIFSLKVDPDAREHFDIGSITFANTFSIRIGDVGIIACFGDGGAVQSKLHQLFLNRIEGKLKFFQFRELLAHFACCRFHLKNPPYFSSLFDIDKSEVTIVCTQIDEEPDFHKIDHSILGKLMKLVLYDSPKDFVEIPNYEQRLLDGDVGFLFDENGVFISHSD